MRAHIIFILPILVLSCSEAKKPAPKNKSIYEIRSNSSFIIPEKVSIFQPIIFVKGDMNVFNIQLKSQTYVDHNFYDADLTEIIVFQIHDSINHFKLVDKEILKSNCKYVWQALASYPDRITKDIEKGLIEGKRINQNTWSLKINIDTDHKFGGYIEKQHSRIIKIEQDVSYGA